MILCAILGVLCGKVLNTKDSKDNTKVNKVLLINSDLRKRQMSIKYDSCKFLIKLAQYKRNLNCKLLYKNWLNDLKKREINRENSINKTMEQE